MLTLDAIRACFEGAIPSAIATCDGDGVPNVSYLSQVEYVDAEHVALSCQFFNTTRRNILANPRATVLVSHPVTGANYRLAVDYLRTETGGPLLRAHEGEARGRGVPRGHEQRVPAARRRRLSRRRHRADTGRLRHRAAGPQPAGGDPPRGRAAGARH